MKQGKNNFHITSSNHNIVLDTVAKMKHLIFIIPIVMFSCSKFVEIDPPKNTLTSETVFEEVATVESALASIYYKIREQGMISGNFGMSTLMGIYADELDYYGSNNNYLEMYNHNVTASNSILFNWWSHGYNLIYAANDIIKGLDKSKSIALQDRAHLKGQALFVRAYIHSLLVDLYGDIPYITTTDYTLNNVVPRTSVTGIYGNIINDLSEAIDLLRESDETMERVVPNQAAAKALLSRMYLYTENWKMAATTAKDLIDMFSLEMNIENVFLKQSTETIWQLKPDGISNRNTQEANQFIIRFIPGQSYSLTNRLMDAFETGDLRRLKWTGSTASNDGLTTLFYANKYKAIFNEPASIEYSIVFRLAEQYLIRAEANTHLGNISEATEDLNIIRNRAGLGNTLASTTNDLFNSILHERYVEFFTEHGHRWFDMKRLGLAENLLSPVKANWKVTNIIMPIPEFELEKNSNLKPQNLGY